MKTPLLVIASLALGTAAIAQDTAPTNSPNAGMPPTGTMPATPDSSMAPPAPGATTPPSSGATTPPDSSSATPPSDPGMSAPAGGMTPPAASPSTPVASTDTSNYPRCSRTITDKCIQGTGTKSARKMRHKG